MSIKPFGCFSIKIFIFFFQIRFNLFLCFFILSYGFLMSGENKDPSQLTLERIFSSEDFKTERFGPARWLEHRTGYTTLEPVNSGFDGKDIVLYNPKTGKPTVLVQAELLKIPGTEKAMDIDNYSWSPKGDKLLVFTNTKRVWRQNTRNDYWLLDLEPKQLWKLGGNAKPSTLMFAKFSPDGTRVAYVCENNIYIQDLNGSRAVNQITFDGSKTVINGTFDWVYEEEYGLRDGYRWSPNGKFLAYWQLDAEGVGNFYLINNTEHLYSQVIPVQYPKVGTTNSAVKISVTAFAASTPEEQNFARMQIAFYASTPSYRSVFSLHGWGQISEELSKFASRGKWGEMGALINDEILETFAVVAPPDELGAAVKERYQGLADRLTLYTPFTPGERDDFWKNLMDVINA